MSFSFGHLCVALLICCYCTVSASLECPDFNNIDVCEDEDLDLLRVSFGECDSKVQPKNAEREPVVKYDEADEDKTYILVMVDPDAPRADRPKMRWWRHWLLTDIPGWSLLSNNPQSLPGTSVTDYQGPSPPPNSGDHRYQLFLFEQRSSDVEPVLTDGERGRWDLNAFVRANNLCHRLVAGYEFLSAN